MYKLCEYVDALEVLVDNEMWPLPKFWEMLFISNPLLMQGTVKTVPCIFNH